MIQFFLSFLFILLSLFSSAQEKYSPKDVDFFNSIMSNAEKVNLSDSAMDRIVVYVGNQLIGKPYVGGILDKPESELLVVDLEELDCVTFLESTVALSIIIKENKTDFTDFCNELKLLRYRNGEMNGYTSRLHYFCEWIEDNQQKGILDNITGKIGGIPYLKDINCISKNSDKYPRLKEDSSVIAIKKIEDELSRMNKYYIPEDSIREHESQIHNGDLIAITTTVEGLDVAHVGIAIYVNHALHLMHASSLNKKVEISELPLCEMVQNKSIWSGIMVSRLKN